MDYEVKHDMTLNEVAGYMDDGTQAQNTKLFKKAKDQIDLNHRCLNEPIPHSEPIDIPAAKKPKPMKFQQTRLMALMETRSVCQECDMMYDRTIPEEVQAHFVMHQRLTHPQQPGKGILDNPIFEQICSNGIHRVHVSRRDAERKERDWYEHALELSESNGLGLFEGQLWHEIFIGEPSAPTHGSKGSGETKEKPRRKAPQYRIYVYSIDYAVASVALVQRIAKAGAYYHGPKTHDKTGKLATPEPDEDQNYVNMDRIFPVLASIDRLWTGVGYRRKGYATTLLDCVREYFIHSMTLEKHQVAFSLPTMEGEAFATDYFTSVFPGCPFVVGREEARYVVENGVLKDLLEAEPKLEKKLSSDSLIFRISL